MIRRWRSLICWLLCSHHMARMPLHYAAECVRCGLRRPVAGRYPGMELWG